MQAQVLYKGKYPNQKPSQMQIALLRKLGVREEVLEQLDRAAAFVLIHRLVAKFYEAKASAILGKKGYVRW